MTSAICPHCGYDLDADELIERGDMRFDPRGDVVWKGEKIHLSAAQRILVHSLLKAAGRAVSRITLAERMGYDGDNPDNLIAVQLCRIKQRNAATLPIQTVRQIGLRWAA